MLKRFCGKQGCKATTTAYYCEKHAATVRQYDRDRGTAAERGYDHNWRKAREDYLRRYPVCVQCEQMGRVTAATVVDHIIPHKGNKELFWSRSNWQPLCKKHHDIKTAKEDGGFGN